MNEELEIVYNRRRWNPYSTAIETEKCTLVRCSDGPLIPTQAADDKGVFVYGFRTRFEEVGMAHNVFCSPAGRDGTVDLLCGVVITPDIDLKLRETHHPREDCFCGPTSGIRFSTAAGHPSGRKKLDDREDDTFVDMSESNRNELADSLSNICDYPPDPFEAKSWLNGELPPAPLSNSKDTFYEAAPRHVIYTQAQMRSAWVLRNLFSGPHIKDYRVQINPSWNMCDLKSAAMNYYTASGASAKKAKILMAASMIDLFQATSRDDTVLATSIAPERLAAMRLADVEYGNSIDGAFEGDLTKEIDNSPVLSEVNCALAMHAVSTDVPLRTTYSRCASPSAMSYPVATVWRGYNGYGGLYSQENGMILNWEYRGCACHDAWAVVWTLNDICDFTTDILIDEPFNVFVMGLGIAGKDMRSVYSRHLPAILRSAANCTCTEALPRGRVHPAQRQALTSLAYYAIAPRYCALARLARLCQQKPLTLEGRINLYPRDRVVIQHDWTFDSYEVETEPVADVIDTVSTLCKADLDGGSVTADDSESLAAELSKLGRDAPEKLLIRSSTTAYAALFDAASTGGAVEAILGDCIRLHDTLAQGRLLRVTAALACMAATYRGGIYSAIADLTSTKQAPSPQSRVSGHHLADLTHHSQSTTG